MKQVLYKNDIYPYNVRVLLGADEEYIVKTFANLEVEDQSWEGWTDDYGGRTIFVGIWWQNYFRRKPNQSQERNMFLISFAV